jgi:cytochrome P450
MLIADREVPDLTGVLKNELDAIGQEILSNGPNGQRAIRYRETDTGTKSIVFVAHREEVVRVLTKEDDFSLCHYDTVYEAFAPPGAFVVMRQEDAKRKQRMAILNAAADMTPWFGPDPSARRELAQQFAGDRITVFARRSNRSFDVIGEYGFFVPYLMIEPLFGLPPPRSCGFMPWLIVLANSRPWGEMFRRETRSYLTEMAWSEFTLAQLQANFEDRSWLIRQLAKCAASRLRAHIERHVDAARNSARTGSLLRALWTVRGSFPEVEPDVYREHVISLTMELAGTALLVPGIAFTRVIQRWLKTGGPDLGEHLKRMKSLGVDTFVDEELRLSPPAAFLLRNATRDLKLGGLPVRKGEYICALLSAAGMDVPQPDALTAGRNPDHYVHFGPANGPHRCYGHLIAPAMLAEMFLGLERLSSLRAARAELTMRFGAVPGRLMVIF